MTRIATFTCQHCGESKSATVYADKPDPKFCSATCHNRANGEAAKIKAERATLCEQCGETISYRAGSPSPKYCSRSCYGTARAKSSDHYKVDEQTGCWVWQRAIHKNGYGKLWNGEKAALAHRVFFERANGPIEPGKVLDHLCGNRACVNPDHLRVVSTTENLRRTSRSRLTAEDVADIRRLAGTMQQKEIALQFGVNRHHISNILAGRGWQDEHS